MRRLRTLVEKAGQFLEEMRESCSALDRIILQEKAVPTDIRAEWKRICELQEFFRREHFRKLAEEISAWETSRDEIRASRLVRGILELMGREGSSPQALLEHLTRSLGADRGIVLSCLEESSLARVLAAANVREPDLTLEEFQISRTVFREVLRSGRGVLIRNPLEDSAYAQQTSILHVGIQSILAGAIRSREKIIGIVYLDSLRRDSIFSDSDRLCLEQVLPLLRSLFFSRFSEPHGGRQDDEVFLDETRAMHGLIGRSPEFLASLALVTKVAPTPAPVLLVGESGTGKELFARAIHALSDRKSAPFVAINCAAIPDMLLESELFGHEKGAFTGADTFRAGRFERAARGTLFLDEVAELKLESQAKLLRFLQSGEIERVGGGSPTHVDARVIAATNQDLSRRVADGGFRPDLYFRLNVFSINLPALRRRKEDIRQLADHFYLKYSALLNLQNLDVRPDVYAALEEYEYPGNIREMENIVYRSLVLSEKGQVTLDCLPDQLRAGALRDLEKNPFRHLVKTTPAHYRDLCERKEQMKQICRAEISSLERRFAEALVARAEGNVSKAAQMAGIDRGQFHRLLRPNDE